MINKQSSQQGKSVRISLIKSIIFRKHSQQPRLNYEYRKFLEFLRPKQMNQQLKPLQIYCKDFLTYYSWDQNLSAYYDFSAILSNIRETILNRVNQDYPVPIHFYNGSFCSPLKRFYYIKKNLLKSKDWIEQSKEGTNKEYDFKNNHPLTAINFQKNQNIQKRNNINISCSSQKSDYSIKLLEKVTKDLSLLIKQINQGQLQASLTGYISNLKSSMSSIPLTKSQREQNYKNKYDSINNQISKRGKVFFQQHSKLKDKSLQKNYKEKEKNYNVQKKLLEQQTYGLKNIRHQKKVSYLKSKTQTVRKKLKDKQITITVSPTTPKPHRQRCLYIRQFSPMFQQTSKKSLFSKTRIKTKTKIKAKSKPAYKQKEQYRTKSKTKRRIKQHSKKQYVKNFY